MDRDFLPTRIKLRSIQLPLSCGNRFYSKVSSIPKQKNLSIVAREFLSSLEILLAAKRADSSRGKCRCRNKGHERDPWHRRCRCYRWCLATRKPLAIWHTPCHAASRPVHSCMSVLRPSGIARWSIRSPILARNVTSLRSDPPPERDRLSFERCRATSRFVRVDLTRPTMP